MRHASFWFKRGLMAMLVWIFILGFIACGPRDEDPDPDELTTSAIATVLESVASGTEVLVEGTIIYVQSNGFYLYDQGEGIIFVKSIQELATPLSSNIGKEVEVTGTFKITGNRPEIDNVTELNILSETGDLPTANLATVASLLAKNPAHKTGAWYRYVELRGRIEVDEVTLQTKFVDDFDDEIPFSTLSSIDALQAYEGERVTITAMLGEYSSIGNQWRLIFVGAEADVVPTPFTAAEAETMVEAWLNEVVPTNILGALQLPAGYDRLEELTITWTTDLGDYLDILPLDDGASYYQVDVTIPVEDVTGTLTATVQYGEASFVVVLNVTVQELEQMTLAEALASENPLVLFQAVVIGFASTQTDSARTLLVQDLTQPNVIITVDYSRIETDNYGLLTTVSPAIGDVIIVAGSYRMTGRPSIVDPFITELTGATQTPVYDVENAPVFDSQSSWEDFPGHNVLVKMVNPYMRYSTSTVPSPTNWIRLGHSADSVGTNFGPDNNKSFAFLIRPVDEIMGETWRQMLDVPLVGNDPIMYDGDIYAFIVYETGTYLQMVIVDPSHVMPSEKQQVVEFLYDLVPTRVEYVAGVVDLGLASDHALVDAGITWTSSHPEIVSTAGIVTFPEFDTVVTLTASYAVNSEPITLEIIVTVAGAQKVVLQVDSVLDDAEDSDLFYIEGIVLAAGYNTAGGFSDLFLQDKTSGRIVLVQGIEGYGETFFDGDLIEFNASLSIINTDNEINKRVVLYEAQLEIIESDFGTVDYRQNAIVIDSHEAAAELLELDKIVYGGVYKITGQFLVRNTTSAWNPGSLNNAIHLNPDASVVSHTQYGTKRMVLNDNGNRGTLGENWVEDILGISEFNRPGISYPGFSYHGTFYAVIKNATNAYFYLSVISPDDFIWESTEEQAARELDEAIPESLASGDLVLPVAHALVDAAITWTSSHPAVIDPNTGVVTYGNADVVVTLTAHYEIGGVSIQTEIIVTVLSIPVMSVTDVLTDATDGDIVRVQGIIVGFHWNGSGTRGALSNGIIIKESVGNQLLYVTGLYDNFGSTLFEYDVDGQILALGDEVIFTATYLIETQTGVQGRHALNIDSALGAALEILESNVSYTFDLTQAVTIDSDVALDAMLEDMNFGQIYKLEGPFFMRGSATAYGTGVNMVP